MPRKRKISHIYIYNKSKIEMTLKLIKLRNISEIKSEKGITKTIVILETVILMKNIALNRNIK